MLPVPTLLNQASVKYGLASKVGFMYRARVPDKRFWSYAPGFPKGTGLPVE